MNKRKICIVTGTRAEYGLLFWIIKYVHKSPELELQLLVTGMHLSPEFGLTVNEIIKDGFPISGKVEMLLSSDSESAIAKSMGLGMIGFSSTYERLKPDILVVLGDRFEILSAVASAVPFRIPIAHIHGGEATIGVIDEPIRHAITKMSHIHFTATDEYKKRVIQMGEYPEHVFCFGAPGIDNVHKLKLLSKKDIYNKLGISENNKIGVITFHPVTLERDSAEAQISQLLKAMKDFPEIYWIFTQTNADTGGRVIMSRITKFVLENPKVGEIFTSLGQIKYLSLLKHSVVMVGNSSSGIIEAPSFKLPVVNIGDRQRGRVRALNVIDVPECAAENISGAIAKALSEQFRSSLNDMNNPYGEGDVSKKIVQILKSVELTGELIKKSFYDMK